MQPERQTKQSSCRPANPGSFILSKPNLSVSAGCQAFMVGDEHDGFTAFPEKGTKPVQCVTVQVVSGLVQEEEGPVTGYGPGYGNFLLFPAGQAAVPGGNRSVCQVSDAHFFYKGLCRGIGQGGIADFNVFQDAALEEVRLLGRIGDVAAVSPGVPFPQFPAVYKEFSVVICEQACHNLQERGFAAAVGAAECGFSARAEGEGDPGQGLLTAVGVGEVLAV